MQTARIQDSAAPIPSRPTNFFANTAKGVNRSLHCVNAQNAVRGRWCAKDGHVVWSEDTTAPLSFSREIAKCLRGAITGIDGENRISAAWNAKQSNPIWAKNAAAPLGVSFKLTEHLHRFIHGVDGQHGLCRCRHAEDCGPVCTHGTSAPFVLVDGADRKFTKQLNCSRLCVESHHGANAVGNSENGHAIWAKHTSTPLGRLSVNLLILNPLQRSSLCVDGKNSIGARRNAEYRLAVRA